MTRDYYDVLGIARSASADEIKRAYRKLALQHHPDKPTGNEEKFKEINEAYQILGDQEKRAQYDQFGHAGDTGSPWGGGFSFDPFQVFAREFTGFEDLFGDLFGVSSARQRTRTAERGDDRATSETITFEELVRGTTREISLERLRTCPRCAGSGAEPKTPVVTCASCGGTGVFERRIRTFLGAMLQRSVCPDCGGEGKRAKKPCSACSGTGRTHQHETLRVSIPPGLEDGTRLRIVGEGESGPRGGPPGDLTITVHVRKHKEFTRSGHDLRSTVAIPFPLAALGGKVTVATIDGERELVIPRGISSGTELRLRGLGIETSRRGEVSARGDHIVTIVIDVPKRLTKTQEDLLRQFSDPKATTGPSEL